MPASEPAQWEKSPRCREKTATFDRRRSEPERGERAAAGGLVERARGSRRAAGARPGARPRFSSARSSASSGTSQASASSAARRSRSTVSPIPNARLAVVGDEVRARPGEAPRDARRPGRGGRGSRAGRSARRGGIRGARGARRPAGSGVPGSSSAHPRRPRSGTPRGRPRRGMPPGSPPRAPGRGPCAPRRARRRDAAPRRRPTARARRRSPRTGRRPRAGRGRRSGRPATGPPRRRVPRPASAYRPVGAAASCSKRPAATASSSASRRASSSRLRPGTSGERKPSSAMRATWRTCTPPALRRFDCAPPRGSGRRTPRLAGRLRRGADRAVADEAVVAAEGGHSPPV